jgi:AraC-like DNA-binding protein
MSGGTIDFDEFENTAEDDFEARNDTDRIVVFLFEHYARAWKAATNADRLYLEPDAVSAILSRLKGRGLVRHQRPYWAITDYEDRLRVAYRLHYYHQGADAQYGEEALDATETDGMEDVR